LQRKSPEKYGDTEMSEPNVGRASRRQSAESAHADERATARAAIVDLTRRMESAWNEADGEAYSATFTDDSDYIAFDGTHLKGRQANARHHQNLFDSVDSVLKGSRSAFEGEPAVRFVAPDVAVVHAMGSILLPWQDEVTPKRRSNQTLVAVKRPEGWRFTAFHNTRYRPMTLPRGAPLRVIVSLMRLRAALSGKRRRPAA
jgi:uncharacterized protein (TIGR02246 family)